jgi:DNA-binding transcriptional MocR family regulator
MQDILRIPKKAKIQWLVDHFANQIRNNELKPGDRLPPQRELARKYSMAVRTVSMAYNRLQRQGLVVANTKNGTRVRQRTQTQAPDTETASREAHNIATWINSPPMRSKMPMIRRHIQDLGASPDLDELLDYPSPNLPTSLVRIVSERLIESGLILKDQVPLLTTGAQHALFVTLSLLRDQCAKFGVEELVYHGLINAANLLGITLVPIRMTPAGIDIDDLRTKFRKTSFRTVILSTWGHNPTTWSIPDRNIRQIAGFAQENDVSIVENDAGMSFFFGVPSVLFNMHLNNYWYIGGFSKIFAPALRFGYVFAPKEFISKSSMMITATTGQSTPVGHYISGSLLANDDTYQRIRSLHMVECQRRIQVVTDILDCYDVFTRTGLYYCWLPLNEFATDRISDAISDFDNLVSSHERYSVSGSTMKGLRIAFGRVKTIAELRRSLIELRDRLVSVGIVGHA